MPAKSSRPGKRGAAGGKGFNPFRASDGKFAPGAHKAKPKKEKPAKGSDEAKLKTGKRYAARAAHWEKKAKEAASAGNAEALKFAQSKAKQAHEKVQKTLGDDHDLTKQAKASRDKAHEHGSKPSLTHKEKVLTEMLEKGASFEQIKAVQETDGSLDGMLKNPKVDAKTIGLTPELNTASMKSKASTAGLSPEASKKASRYHARAKHWEKKAQEAASKAKTATTDVDRKIAEAAAAHAAKKAEASAKLVEKAAGKDHPLAKEARAHAEAAKTHSGVKVAPKQVDAPKSVSGPAKIEKGEYVTHQHGTMKIDHVGGTNIYGTTAEGKALIVPLKAKDELTGSSKSEYETKKSNFEAKQKADREIAHKAALSVTAGTGMVPNKFSPGGVPGPKYEATKVGKAKEMDLGDFGSHSKSIQDKINSKEKEAILHYSGSGYSSINSGLRKGSVTGSTATHVANLDSAMAKSPLPQDTLLYRGAGGGKSIETWSKLQPGDHFQDSGFTSTSVRASSSFASDYGVKLTISAPKGYPGLAMDSKLSHYASEKEVLLPRNTRFKVTKVSKTSGGGLDVHVEIVPNHD